MTDKDCKPRLLWADDDLLRRRFLHSKMKLRRKDWELVTALDVMEAIEKLSQQVFNFILLDQMLPFSRTEPQTDCWGAARILYWLKGKPQPHGPPPVREIDRLKALSPMAGNADAPSMIFSAFDDPAVRRSIQSLVPDIRMETKPFDPDELIEMLEHYRAGEGNDTS